MKLKKIIQIKRIIPMFLIFALVIGYVPAPGFAFDGENPYIEENCYESLPFSFPDLNDTWEDVADEEWNLPEGGYVGIVPAWGNNFTIAPSNYLERLSSYFIYRTMTNPTTIAFGHTDSASFDRFNYDLAKVTSLGSSNFQPDSTTVEISSLNSGNTIHYFATTDEGFYRAILGAVYRGEPAHVRDSSFIFVNVQRTGSYVEIGGITNQDTSRYPTIPASERPFIINPDTVSVGRPSQAYGRPAGVDYSHGGGYTATWEIRDIDGTVVLSGTGSPDDIDVSGFPVGIYTVRVEVREQTPDGFPQDPDIVSVSYGNFVITTGFTFTKQDNAGNVLPGAEFQLFARNADDTAWNTEPAGTQTSAANGHVTFTGLQPGRRYRLVETAAPAGFIVPQGYWILEVSKAPAATAGTITVTSIDGAPALASTDGTFFLANKPENRDLSLTKLVNGLPRYYVTTSTDIVYTITVANNSNFTVPAGHRVVDDLRDLIGTYIALPTSVTISGIAGATYTLTQGILTVEFPAIPTSVRTITITVTTTLYPGLEMDGQEFTNIATLRTPPTAENPGGTEIDRDDAVVILPEPEDTPPLLPPPSGTLTIRKQVNGVDRFPITQATLGNPLVYTITVTNNTNYPATGYIVRDDFSHLIGTYIAPFTLANITLPSQANATFTNNVLLVTLGTVPANSSATITITAQLLPGLELSGQSFTNTAFLHCPEGKQIDEDDATVVLPGPELTITKLVNNVDRYTVTAATVNNTLVYTITVRNNSFVAAPAGFRVVDDFSHLIGRYLAPFTLENVILPSGANAIFVDNVLSVTLGAIPAHSEVVIRINVNLLNGLTMTGQQFINIATLRTPPTAENPGGTIIDDDNAIVVLPGPPQTTPPITPTPPTTTPPTLPPYIPWSPHPPVTQLPPTISTPPTGSTASSSVLVSPPAGNPTGSTLIIIPPPAQPGNPTGTPPSDSTHYTIYEPDAPPTNSPPPPPSNTTTIRTNPQTSDYRSTIGSILGGFSSFTTTMVLLGIAAIALTFAERKIKSEKEYVRKYARR